MDESELPLDRRDENMPILTALSIDIGEDGGTDSGQATVPYDAVAQGKAAGRGIQEVHDEGFVGHLHDPRHVTGWL